MDYSLDEICLYPAAVTMVQSRSQCDITYDNKLPLYVAPMTSLINIQNSKYFTSQGFNVILPRTIDFDIRINAMKEGSLIAIGLDEANHLYHRFSMLKANGELDYVPRICIDQANGHMMELLNVCADLKNLLGQEGIWIMTGNIANPETYYEYAKIGIDAVRVGIGTGNVCTTSCKTGIHYPMASLIIECNYKKNVVKDVMRTEIDELSKLITHESALKSIEKVSTTYKSVPIIIADGGFKRIDQIIKALALGADYVMLGEMIAKSKEACGDIKWTSVNGTHCNARQYYGMSTERAQKNINKASNTNNRIKQSEGIEKWVPVEYSIEEWVEDFEKSLQSSMSYCNAFGLEDFVGKVSYNAMSMHTFNEYYKWQQ